MIGSGKEENLDKDHVKDITKRFVTSGGLDVLLTPAAVEIL